MEKEFIGYNEALTLKELGFDEPCFGIYYSKDSNVRKTDIEEDGDAPLYQQAFRWFRQKYDLFIAIVHYENGYSINDLRRFETYEEAELACLKKLIEIVKEKK